MPVRSHLRCPSFLPVPSALLSFPSPAGGSRYLLVGWVGIVCSSPALLSLSVRCREEDMAGVVKGEPFTLSLPDEEMLPALTGTEPGRAGERLGMGGTSPFLTARMTRGAEGVDFPVRIDCICRSSDYGFGQNRISGEIVALHIDGIRHSSTGPLDLCGLNPFRRRLRRHGGGSSASGILP